MATSKYIQTIGRRKTARARARLTEASKQSVTINGKDVDEYFPTKELQDVAKSALSHAEKKFSVSLVVSGGGIAGQAVAVRHAISRALIEGDRELRGNLKKAGYLTRDPRAKERRKPGLKKARKSPQWSKR